MADRLTLGDLLFDAPLTHAEQVPALHGPAFAKLLKRIPGASLGAEPLSSLLTRALAKVLDVDIAELMVSTWIKYRELIEADDDGGEGTLVALTDHALSSKHEPKIEVVWNGKVLLTLDVTIELELKLKAAQLLVQKRLIRELHLGKLKSEGTLSLEGEEILQKPLGSVKLPGKIAFDPGLPLTIDAWKESRLAAGE